MNTHVLVAIGCFCIGIILRLSLALRYKWVGQDVFYHLVAARAIRTQRKLPQKLDMWVNEEEYDHPPLAHLLLSLVPPHAHCYVKYSGVAMSVFTAVSFWFIVSRIVSQDIALYAVSYYMLTPGIISTSYTFDTRALGGNLLLLASGVIYLAVEWHSMPMCVLSGGLVALTLLSHRRATQTIFVLFVALLLLMGHLEPILALFIGFLAACILSKGFYLKVLKGHLNFVRSRARRVKSVHEALGNQIRDLPSWFVNFPASFVWLLMIVQTGIPRSDFASLASAIINSMGAIWFIGGGFTHAWYAVPWMAISMAGMPSGETYLLLGLGLSGVLAIFRVIRDYSSKQNIVPDDLLRLFQYVNKVTAPNEILLTDPIGLCYKAAYFTHCRILTGSGGTWKGLLFRDYLYMFQKRDGTVGLAKRFNARWILAQAGGLRGLPIAGRRGEYLLYGPLEVDSGKTTQGRTCAGKLP